MDVSVAVLDWEADSERECVSDNEGDDVRRSGGLGFGFTLSLGLGFVGRERGCF